MSPPRAVATGTLLRLALAGFAAVAAAHLAFAWDPTPWLALLPPCPMRSATAVPCPGCGMARALGLLAQLRLADAVAMHPAAPLLIAAAGAAAARPTALAPARRRVLCGVAVAVLIAIWAARGQGLLPPLPGPAVGAVVAAGL